MKHQDILNSLTIEEKAKWTSGIGLWNFLGNKKLNIKQIRVADGPHGVRAYKKKNDELDFSSENKLEKSTMFPIEAAMAATFNPELIYQAGETIGKECNMFNVDILLAPGVNQKRSPLGGRNFEYYSEDPFLTGKMATAFINGIQSTGVGACIKHFALNEQETQRRVVNSIADERTLNEFYLLPFEMAIKEAKPFAVMSSYNRVNGEYAAESKSLLKDILRDKWKYDGIVMSDWGGVQNKVKSIKNGLNVEMPGPSEFYSEMIEAINKKELTIEELDNSLLPLLKLSENIKKNKNKGLKTNLNENHLIASLVAEEAIVLLKNDGILPLKGKEKVGLIGDFAKNPRINGGGSATLKPHIIENPLEELGKYFELNYASGYIEENTNDDLLNDVIDVAQNCDLVIYYTGTTEKLESEGKERNHMLLPKGHLDVLKTIKKYSKKVIVILNNGSALDLTEIYDDSNAIIESWLLGGANAVSLRKILLGEVNPSGRLSETFPLNIESTPHFASFPSYSDNVEYYGDIINNGYRYYDTHKYPVRFPFGFGLSYTKFRYSNLVLSHKELTDNEILKVNLQVQNTGAYDGFETVQVYVSDKESYYPKPSKELKGFKKVYIKAGETKDVCVLLDTKSFSVYSVDFLDFRVEPGEFEIMVGSNVRDIYLIETINYVTEIPLRKNLTLNHPYYSFEKYRNDTVSYITEKYRKIEWYEKEEPILRVFKRLKKQFKISEKDYNEMLNRLK